MFNEWSRIEATTNDHFAVEVHLIKIALDPAKLRILSFPKGFDQFFQMMRIPHVVLVQ